MIDQEATITLTFSALEQLLAGIIPTSKTSLPPMTSTELREKIERFRKDNNLDVYTSDDYCGMTNGKQEFYFGYEVTACPKHKGKDYCFSNESDCDLREWCFTASEYGMEELRLRQSEVSPEEGEEPFWYLVAGIGKWLQVQGSTDD